MAPIDLLDSTEARSVRCSAPPMKAHAQPAETSHRPREYVLGALAVAAATAVVGLVGARVSESDRVMIFLLAVALVGFRVALGPAIATAILSVAAFDLFFVEPFFTLAVDEGRYVLTFIVMASVGVVLSSLTARLRLRARQAREAEARTAALYQLAHELVAASDPRALAVTAAAAIERAFDVDVSVFLRGSDGASARVAERGAPIDPQERGDSLHLPMLGQDGAIGAVMVRGRPPGARLDAGGERVLGTFVGQVALALERTRLAAAHREAARQAEVERLRSTLLASVSHDLRTPLGSIVGSATTLLDRDAHIDAGLRRDLLHGIHDEAERLARLLDGLLTMTRLEGGALQIRREWQVPEEVIGAAIRHLGERQQGREILVSIEPGVQLVAFDGMMVELALINILDNALKYTPAGAPIEITVRSLGDRTTFAIGDRGPGVPAGERARLFDKLYRGEGARALAGAGLGLAIARAVVEAHGGTIRVDDRVDGPGSVFEFSIPTSAEPPPRLTDPPAQEAS